LQKFGKEFQERFQELIDILLVCLYSIALTMSLDESILNLVNDSIPMEQNKLSSGSNEEFKDFNELY
jgi:hypothetical protein